MTSRGMEEMWNRPPYLTSFRSAEGPLIALSTLLSRADSTPLSQRRRDPTNLLDCEGRPIADPSIAPPALAFEVDANVSFEKWQEYWRKIHGPRFIHAQDPGASGIERLLRYDQVHRIPGGPTSFVAPPYAAPVDQDGQLFDSVVCRVPGYRRPQWDGIAYLAFETIDDLKAVLNQEKVRTRITPEDQVIFREIAPVVTAEYIILPSATQRDPILLVKTHEKREGITRAEFQEHWLHHHANLVLTKPATHRYVKRYAQLHNVGPVVEGQPFWHPAGSRIDGVTIMAFANMNDVEDFLISDDYADVEADEHLIADPVRSEYWTALTYNVVNRIHPERRFKP